MLRVRDTQRSKVLEGSFFSARARVIQIQRIYICTKKRIERNLTSLGNNSSIGLGYYRVFGTQPKERRVKIIEQHAKHEIL